MPSHTSNRVTQVRGVNPSSDLTAAERVQLFFDGVGNPDPQGFDKTVLDNDLKLVSAASGETVFELTVKKSHADAKGDLHPGAIGLIFDICTTTALIPDAIKTSWQYLGVTRNLNITYIHPAPIGTTLRITSTVIDAGKQLATIRGVATEKNDGQVLCTAEHLKFNFGPAIEKL